MRRCSLLLIQAHQSLAIPEQFMSVSITMNGSWRIGLTMRSHAAGVVAIRKPIKATLYHVSGNLTTQTKHGRMLADSLTALDWQISCANRLFDLDFWAKGTTSRTILLRWTCFLEGNAASVFIWQSLESQSLLEILSIVSN